jgi:hypothetical protein
MAGMRRRRRAITYAECIVVMLIIMVLVAILLPMRSGIHGRSRRVQCASQLRFIGQGLLLYANDNRGAYPRTRASKGPVRVPTWGTGAAATQPFTDPNAPALNDVTAGLFLLTRMQLVASGMFVCPSSPHERDPLAAASWPPLHRSNFTDVTRHLSYSYQNWYPDDAAISRGFVLTSRGAVAVLADKNPGAVGGNSRNHDEFGQNVLYHDGHAAWQTTRLAGVTGDDIYRAGDGRIVASPTDTYSDSVLLPSE